MQPQQMPASSSDGSSLPAIHGQTGDLQQPAGSRGNEPSGQTDTEQVRLMISQYRMAPFQLNIAFQQLKARHLSAKFNISTKQDGQ